MEPHEGKPVVDYSVDYDSTSIEQLYEAALAYCNHEHRRTLEHYRFLDVGDLQAHDFWAEYLWCVYASGFNAKVLSKKFTDLMTAYGPWTFAAPYAAIWERVEKVIANKNKCVAAVRCREMLQKLGWDKFKSFYCLSPDTLEELPFIGGITKFHLARNIGLDCVKPDLHLTRLAAWYEFDSPEDMCVFLGALYEERIGVVDFILWAYCAAYGTKQLEEEE